MLRPRRWRNKGNDSPLAFITDNGLLCFSFPLSLLSRSPRSCCVTDSVSIFQRLSWSDVRRTSVRLGIVATQPRFGIRSLPWSPFVIQQAVKYDLKREYTEQLVVQHFVVASCRTVTAANRITVVRTCSGATKFH